jgi:hypothetical protein
LRMRSECKADLQVFITASGYAPHC